MCKLTDFNNWVDNAKSGDKYIYHTGLLAKDKRTDLELRDLADLVLDKCCDWTLSVLPKKVLNNNIQLKNNIRLFQKAQKYWNIHAEEVLFKTDYIAVKL